MGNSQGSSKSHGAAEARDEPLEAYLREKQRNDHLKNLGFKRQTSFRKSIAKKLKRHSKHRPPQEQPPPQNNSDGSTTLEVVDSGPSNLCDEASSLRRPSYASSNHTRSSSNPNLASSFKAVDNSPTKRGMENLRKSLRASFRKKKNKDEGSTGDFVKDRTGGSSKSKIFQQDEIAVRAGTCNFDVKYLGCIEVFESRGMTICEEALKKLKSSKKKAVRAILYVNGDGLRVVDHDTKGLLVDQTIEKVSFCAPDHNYDKGFSYICRDGTTRRWMCHGFMAVKETGDRLSHAVGCAFAICLEKKQKRDQECAVTMSFDNSNSSFTRIGSFRQATITERLFDPQGIKPSEPPPKPSHEDPSENPFAIARPRATDLMIQRQTSFREFSRLQSRTSPFKRQLSLRVCELPSSLERKSNDATEFGSINKVAVQSQSDPFGELCEQFKNEAFFSQPTSFNTSLFTKAELTTVPEDDDAVFLPPSPAPIQLEPQQQPPLRPASEESSSEGPTSLDVFKMSFPPMEGDNPWDLVPDQPAKFESNGNKSPFDLVMEADATVNNNEEGTAKQVSNGGMQLMDDPFDADWVSVALKQSGLSPQQQFV